MGDMEKMKWESHSGRLRFHHFDEYLKTGVQIFPDSYLVDLMKSWRITKRILKTRAKPRMVYIKEQNGWIVYRNPKIHGDEYIIRTLNAMKCMYGEDIFS
jgi:hypothetical protein